jgi:hypothetical protein
MEETTLQEWKILNKQSITPLPTYQIFESEHLDVAVNFSNIVEWSMMKYCSRLEIYLNKLAPQLIFDSCSSWFLFDLYNQVEFMYDWLSDGIICFRQLINRGRNNYSYPFVIFNLLTLDFAKIDDNSLVSLKKADLGSVIGLKINDDKTETIISFKFNELKWQPFNKFA